MVRWGFKKSHDDDDDDDDRSLLPSKSQQTIFILSHLDGLDGRRSFPSPARGRAVPRPRPRHADGVLRGVSSSARRRRRHLQAPIAAARRHRRGECARRRGRGLVRLGAMRLGEVGEGLAVPRRRLAAVVRHCVRELGGGEERCFGKCSASKKERRMREEQASLFRFFERRLLSFANSRQFAIN